MMKFLRKYTKHMLVFVTIGILVSWLLGSTLPSLLSPNPGVVTVGQAFGEEVKRRHIDFAALRGDTLRRMGLPWQKPWILDVRQPLYDQTPPLDTLHWMLLVDEAKRSGVLVSDERLAQFKSAAGIGPAMLARIQEQRYLALEDIDEIIRDFLVVREHARQNIGSIKVSTARIRHLLRDLQERVRTSGVIVPASQLLDEDEIIDEQEIRSAFERSKDMLPGESGLGFGYKWPARLRVEYLVLNVEEVESVITVTDREARDYWTVNKEKFRKPPAPATQSAEPTTQPAEPTTQPAEPTTQPAEPATQPAEPPTTQQGPAYEKYSEAKEAVVAELRKKKARERSEEVMLNFLSLELTRDWDFTNRGEDRYPQVPEVVKQDGYYELMLRRYANREPRVAPLIEVRRTELSTAQELADLPGIGGSSFALATGRRHQFVSLLGAVQGLGTMPETGASELRSLYLARYQSTDRVLRDPAGNCYGFRVAEFVEPTAPDSLEEVRDRVIADTRTARAYRRAEQLAKRFAEDARETSLEDALEADTDRMEELGSYARIRPGSPTPRIWAPGISGSVLGYRDEQLINDVFELAKDFDPEQPKPIAALAAPSQKTWLVIRIEGVTPVTEDAYENSRDQLRLRLLHQRVARARAAWYDDKRIEKRTGWSVHQGDS